MPGLLCLSGLISVPLASVIGAKYFRDTPGANGAVDVRVCGLGGGADVRFLGHQTQHPMTPRPLFFDLDHTLWDFETNSRLALRSGFEAMGLSKLGIPSVLGLD